MLALTLPPSLLPASFPASPLSQHSINSQAAEQRTQPKPCTAPWEVFVSHQRCGRCSHQQHTRDTHTHAATARHSKSTHHMLCVLKKGPVPAQNLAPAPPSHSQSLSKRLSSGSHQSTDCGGSGPSCLITKHTSAPPCPAQNSRQLTPAAPTCIGRAHMQWSLQCWWQ